MSMAPQRATLPNTDMWTNVAAADVDLVISELLTSSAQLPNSALLKVALRGAIRGHAGACLLDTVRILW